MLENPVWHAHAEYEDGTVIDKKFPYTSDGDFEDEENRKYEIECWLLNYHEGCISYSVDCDEED